MNSRGRPRCTLTDLNGTVYHGMFVVFDGGSTDILRLFCIWHRARHKHEPVPDKPHVPVKFPSLFRPNVHPFWGPCPCM